MKLSEISMTRLWFQFFPCLSRIFLGNDIIWRLRIFFRWFGSTTNPFFLPPNKNPRWMRRFFSARPCLLDALASARCSQVHLGVENLWGENMLIGVNSSNENKGWTQKKLKMWFLIEHWAIFLQCWFTGGYQSVFSVMVKITKLLFWNVNRKPSILTASIVQKTSHHTRKLTGKTHLTNRTHRHLESQESPIGKSIIFPQLGPTTNSLIGYKDPYTRLTPNPHGYLGRMSSPV